MLLQVPQQGRWHVWPKITQEHGMEASFDQAFLSYVSYFIQ